MAERIRIISNGCGPGTRVELEDGTRVPGVQRVTITIDRTGVIALVTFVQPILQVTAEIKAA